MKLEVGMYVRTLKGKLFKIQKLSEDYIYLLNTECFLWKSIYGGDYCFRFPYENEVYTIAKASHNIIDLIEVGDYVNGEKVGYIDNCNGAMREYYYDYEDAKIDVGHLFEEIETIVTKEQFESMSYKVGE